MTDFPPHALAWCALLRSGIGAAKLRRLVDTCGGAGPALHADPSTLRACGLQPDAIARLRRAAEPTRADHAWLCGANRGVVGWSDPAYPDLLRQSPSPPAALFFEGDAELLSFPQVAVVGSRSASPAGREHAAAFAAALARAGFVVTSGLAAGIDAMAHRGALDAGGTTTAVVATGPDLQYPRSNAALAARIAAEGLVVTEYLPGTAPRRANFPCRNRIIAGLSLGTLVIEAAQHSGALITARLAGDAGREVFAVPGSIRNPAARGCHRLIRQGAALVEDAREVVELLGPQAARLASGLRGPATTASAREPDDGPGIPLPATTGAASDPARSLLWRALDEDPADLDRLAARTGLTVPELSTMLLEMELDGCVHAEHGRYARRGPVARASIDAGRGG